MSKLEQIKDKTYTRAVALLGFFDFIEARGGNAQMLFDSVGLDVDRLKNPQALISWPRACRLLELAAKELDDPYLGLEWAKGLPDDMPNTGPTVFLTGLMPDVVNLADTIMKYQKIHTNGIHYSYIRDESTGRVTGYIDFHPETPPYRQYAEHILAIARLGISRIIGPPFDTPKEVRFQHNAPADMSVYNEIFGCPIVFNASRTEISYDLKILEKEMRKRWTLLKPLFELYLKRQERKLPKTQAPMTTAITGLIPYILASGKSDIVSVAFVLNLSPKKMQRLLKDEGTNYSAILDDIRAKTAKRMLFESNISVAGIAETLDYASTVPFANACNRWYGVSPRQLRKQLRAGSE